MRLAACFVAVLLATVLVGLAPEVNLIWVANGMLLAYLLLAPRRRWPAYLCAGFAAQCLGAMLVDARRPLYFAFVALNMAEVLIGALLLRRRSSELPRFTDRAYVIRFIAYAVAAGTMTTGAVYALLMHLLRDADPMAAMYRWVMTDGLGTAVATPAYVALLQMRSGSVLRWRREWLYLILPVAVSLALFSQQSAPLVFLLYPLLLLALLRLGLGWAAMATLFVAGAGSWFTLHAQGAFAAFRAVTPMEPAVMLQIFVGGAMFMLYSVAAVVGSMQRDISDRKLAEQKLQDAFHAAKALAVVDPVTGVANRRRLDEYLASEWRRALRDCKPLAMLLIDADYFKSYNDSYGHTRGDICLRQIAGAAEEVVSRPGDLVARYGGEEFAVVLPDTDAIGAEEIAREITRALRRRDLAHGANPRGVVTVSIGCAAAVPGFGQTAGMLVELADAALYRAKASGRNAVCSASAMSENDNVTAIA